MHRLKTVLIAVLLLAGFTAYAQQIQVTGVVTSRTDGYGVIGAAVMEKGTSNGVITDCDGNFSLKVEAGKILEISCIGYATVEVPASEVMSVILDEDVAELSEVVVVGYQTQRKADLTGSVSVIKTDEMKTTSGLNSLNTNDIETMQVLKDAASSSRPPTAARTSRKPSQEPPPAIPSAMWWTERPGTSPWSPSMTKVKPFPALLCLALTGHFQTTYPDICY